MNVLIVEDEIKAVNKLKRILKELDLGIAISGTCSSVSETIEWLNTNNIPDLIFLDIQLSDGISFELFKQIKIECPIIFVTAFDEFAIQAFKVNSIDYILKPYSIKEIKNSLDKLNNLSKTFNSSERELLYKELAKTFQPKFKTRFFTKLNNQIYSINSEDVITFKYEDSSTVLTDKDQRKYIIDYSLDALEKLLNPLHFFRINRQFIISYKSISKMMIDAKNRIKVHLINEEKTEDVSRAKTKEFKEWLNQ